jgi:DNA-directed RNA polymerase specialized sigma24 family protein
MEILVSIILLVFAGGLVFYSLLPMSISLSTAADAERILANLRRKWKRITRYGTELGGYVHDTSIHVWISFTQFAHSAGTWTATVASNVWYARRTAADASATTYIPLTGLFASSVDLKGAYLKSVDVHFRVVTAALDALEAHLYKATLGADGSLLTVAEVTTTYDAGHDTAPERIDVDEHLMTLTLDTPEWIDGDAEMLFVEIVADAAATSLLDYFGANVSLTVRL